MIAEARKGGAVRAALAAAGAALALSACATVRPAATDAAPAAVADATDEFGWFLESDETQLLYFGEESTDNVGLRFRCAVGTRHVDIFVPTDTAGSGRIRLRAGAHENSYPAFAEADPLAEELTAGAGTRTDDPVLQAFRASGRISVIEDAAYPQDAATDAERERIAQFFSSCG